MYKNFRFKLFFPLLLFIVCIAFISLASLFYYQNKHISEQSHENFEKSLKQFDKKFSQEIQTYESFIKLISKDTKAINLYLSKNQTKLYDYYQPLYKELKSKYNISHFYFHSLDKKVFLRVHNQKKHSDIIDRFTLNQAIKTKKIGHGIEFGIAHNLTLRVVVPWVVDNKIIGYIELGKEIDYFTPELAKLGNIDIVFTISKDKISKQNYEKWIAISKQNKHFKKLSKHYIIDSSLFSISPELSLILDKKETIKNISVKNDKQYYKAYSKTFHDVAGNAIGKLFILNNMTHEYEFLYALIINSTLMILFLFIIVLSYYYKLLQKTENILDFKHKEIYSQAITDSLTKLYNKRHFDYRLPLKINNIRNNNSYLSFIMIDIDNFKKYNDLYGHPEGDKVIATIGKEIRKLFKRENDECFRVGGEEFTVLLESFEVKHIHTMVQKLKDNIEALNIEHKENESFNKVTISIGVNIQAGNNISEKHIYSQADIALYQSKQQGRNRITFFE